MSLHISADQMADGIPLEEWLVRALGGDCAETSSLPAHLARKLTRRLQDSGQALSETHAAATIQMAERELARFQGATEDEFVEWLESLASLTKPSFDTHRVDPQHDATLQRPPLDTTLQRAPLEETLRKPLATGASPAFRAALERAEEVLNWRCREGVTIEQTAERLECSPVEAAAVLRVGVRRSSGISSGDDAAEVLPIDRQFADALIRIDSVETGKNTASDRDASGAVGDLQQMLDELDAGDQTMVLDSSLAKRMRKSSEALPNGIPFGDYVLQEVIAKGGMGVVHKAVQRRLNRVVAIKTILAGQFADQEDVDRFYAEAESAANLRHPNIVSIHEIGEHEGQHYFSMDYIEGESLSDKVRDNALPPRIAAQYTLTIAKAIQYAHDQGILHRDLKPSNILVDHANTPLVTDFGLAKQVDGQSQMTMSGTVIGTPSYMPPEQAAGRIADVDVRSDVYSLGAILFELLTGRPPFRSSSPFETIRQVLETEPITPRLLNASVPADLETICLKCLQKEPGKRYSSAGELADELNRYLIGEPILARPISRVERSLRWCRRNPKMATLAAATVVAFLATFATVTIAYIQTTAALAGETAARADAEESYQQARKAVDDFFTTVSENTLLNRYGMQPIRRELLEKALQYYQRFLVQRRDDPTIADEVAMTLYRVGFINDQMGDREEALKSLEQARTLQESLVQKSPEDSKRLHVLSDTLVELARIQLEGDSEAERLLKQVVELRQRMVDLDRTNTEFARELANGHMNLGILFRERAKLAQHQAALAADDQRDTVKQLSETAKRNHQLAVEAYETAQQIRRSFLSQDHGRHAKLLTNYGMGFFNLAQAAADIEDVQSAEANYREAVKIFAGLRDEENPDFVVDLNLATCHRVLADHISKHGDFAEAIENYQSAERILEPLALRNPDELRFQRALADTYKNWGQALFEQEQTDPAFLQLDQALEIEASLAKRHPESARDRLAYHNTSVAYAQYRVRVESPEESVRVLSKLRDYYKLIVQDLPIHQQRDEILPALAEVAMLLAEVHMALGEDQAALQDFQTAAGALEAVVQGDPSSPLQVDLVTLLLQASETAKALDDLETARTQLKRAESHLDSLRKSEPGESPPWLQQLEAYVKALRAELL